MFQIIAVEGIDGEVIVAFFVIFFTSVLFLIKFIPYAQHHLESTRRDAERNLIVQPPQPSYNGSEEPCPVCYSNISLAVETGCFHLFCGSCMMGLIQYARHRSISCPVCRAAVLMLYPVFTVDEYNYDRNSDLGRTRYNLINEIREYNQLFSRRNRSLLQAIFEVPVFVRRLWRSFNNPNDVFVQNHMKTLLYIILFAVATYIIFPFDLFPEVYFGIFGLLDDILVLSVSLLYLTNVYRSLFFDLEHRA